MTDFRYVVKFGQVTECSQRFKDSSLTKMIRILKSKLEIFGEGSSGKIEAYLDNGQMSLQYQKKYKSEKTKPE